MPFLFLLALIREQLIRELSEYNAIKGVIPNSLEKMFSGVTEIAYETETHGLDIEAWGDTELPFYEFPLLQGIRRK